MAWIDAQGQAGGGIASSLINVIGQNYINNRNIEEQRRAQAVAQQSWREQQEYNSPKNQVSRLQAAGFNPDMLYGQSSSGVAGNAPTPAQSINQPVLNPHFLDPMTMSNIMKSISEQNLNDAKTETEKYVALKEYHQQQFLALQTRIEEALEDYTINERKNISKISAIKYYQEDLKIQDSVLETIKNYEALGVKYVPRIDKNSGYLIVEPDVNDFAIGGFRHTPEFKKFKQDIKNQYDLSEKQLQKFDADISQIWTRMSIDVRNANIEQAYTIVNLIAEAVNNGISLIWHDDGTVSVVTDNTGAIAMNIVNRVENLLTGVLGIVLHKGSSKVNQTSTSKSDVTITTKN